MNKLKATFRRQYRKASPAPGVPGKLVFVYAISGPKAEVEAYEKAQGSFLINDDDDGAPLMFTVNAAPQAVNNVIITRNGQYRIDTSELDRQAALVSQLGGNLGQAIANNIAASMNFGASRSGSTAGTDEGEGTETSLTAPEGEAKGKAKAGK